MTWVNLLVIGSLVVADVMLILELREARKEMRAIRKDIPAWVGVSLAMNLLTMAAKWKGKTAE